MTDEEINRRIHEEIMGAKWYRPNENSNTRYLLTDETAKVMERQGFIQPATGSEPNEVVDVPDYCRSIEQAFKVLAKLYKEKDFAVQITGVTDWSVLISGKNTQLCRDESLPRAICLAVLQTLEITKAIDRFRRNYLPEEK